MKNRIDIKYLAFALSFLILLQSCSVYHSSPSTIDEAIKSTDKVKIVSPEQNIYKFNRLVKIDSLIYGYAKNKSLAAKELSGQIILKDADGKYAKIQLYDRNIASVHLKNHTASTLVSIAVPIVIICIIAGIGYAAADSISLEWSNN